MNSSNFLQLGEAIRQARKRKGWTIRELAHQTRLSGGLISKIENARTVPSLPVLLSLSNALSCQASSLMSSMEKNSKPHYVLIRKEDRQTLDRENKDGYCYEAIISGRTGEGIFENVLLRLNGVTTGNKVTTDGDMLIYVLSGNVLIQLGGEQIRLHQGDTLFFDGRIPHMSQHTEPGESQLWLIYFLNPTSNT